MIQIKSKHPFTNNISGTFTIINNRIQVVSPFSYQNTLGNVSDIVNTLSFTPSQNLVWEEKPEDFLPLVRLADLRSFESITPSISLIILEGGSSFGFLLDVNKHIRLTDKPVLVLGTFTISSTFRDKIQLTTPELIRNSLLISIKGSKTLSPVYKKLFEGLDNNEAILVKGPKCEWLENLRVKGKGHIANQVNLFKPSIRTLETFAIQNDLRLGNLSQPTKIDLYSKHLLDLIEVL